jgi:hypothetical protein
MATQMAACGYESPRASGLECEADTLAHSTDDLVHLTAKRSVFSAAELEGFNATPDNPMKVIDFLLVGHAEHPISLDVLLDKGVFSGRPPQSICESLRGTVPSAQAVVAIGF